MKGTKFSEIISFISQMVTIQTTSDTLDSFDTMISLLIYFLFCKCSTKKKEKPITVCIDSNCMYI